MSSVAQARPLVVSSTPCATLSLLPSTLPFPDDSLRERARPPGMKKVDREAISGVVGSRTSSNFVVKWGAAGDLDDDTVAALLDSLETAWSVEVDEMAHPAPVGTDQYLFNVYIEDTGLSWISGGTSYELSGSGSSGYYFTDPQGYPMVVLNPDATLEADLSAMVAAHEFYHAVQAGLGSYSYSGRGAWYWEASATWIASEVFPENPDYAMLLFGYALLPALPVDFFDYPDTGSLQEYHQYGAFIVPRFLTEKVADWTVVRDSWVSPDPDGDPIAGLDMALAAWDTSVATELVDMAAHNAIWDYRDGAIYAQNVQDYAPYFPDSSAAIAILDGSDLTGAGTTGWPTAWAEIDPDRLPRAYGYNLVGLLAPPAGNVRLSIQTEAQGSAGSVADWSAELVVVGPDGPTYLPVGLADGAGRQTLSLTGAETQVWLAVAVTSAERDQNEVFTWSYLVDDGGGDSGSVDTGADTGADT
ncbi:MAG: hypothetical protein GXP62_18445, partial [Oligoflexia bacterium]|nr:hypothetical protein [Oligoflexia bacterium]